MNNSLFTTIIDDRDENTTYAIVNEHKHLGGGKTIVCYNGGIKIPTRSGETDVEVGKIDGYPVFERKAIAEESTEEVYNHQTFTNAEVEIDMDFIIQLFTIAGMTQE